MDAIVSEIADGNILKLIENFLGIEKGERG